MIILKRMIRLNEELYRLQNISYIKDNTLLRSVDLYQYKGETIGLLGLHDSGKTLLSCIMSGELKPSGGYFFYEEKPVSHKEFSRHVFMIQEQPSLIGSLSVMENLFVIRRHHLYSIFVRRKAILIETMNLMKELNLSINPHEKICNLSRLEQCLVEMLKAYILGAKLIILDNIPINIFHDVRFSNLLDKLKSRNVFFLITSSDIYQLQLFSDRIYILSDKHIVKWIYNEKRNKIDISKLYNKPIAYIESPSTASSKISVRVDNLCYKSLENISFQLFEGEIVTMFDLFRNTSVELLDILANLQKVESGSIYVYDEICDNPANSPFVFANFDLKNSTFETLSLRDNICMSNYRKLAYPIGILKKSRIKYFEENFLKEYKNDGITAKKRCYHPSKQERLAIYMSKFELLRNKIIFCINPEKFIDYDTIYILKNSLQRIANNGNTICIITCDFEKVYQLASRHLVLLSDSVQEYEKVNSAAI